MIATFAAFVFIINQDSMTDAKTYEARVGDRSAYVSILCGGDTDGKPIVQFKTPGMMAVYSDQRASVEYRFDEDAAQKKWPFWSGDQSTLAGKDAAAFAERAMRAQRLRVRIGLADGGYIELDTQALTEQGAIGRVLQSCSSQ
jgi:hypothetical protein